MLVRLMSKGEYLIVSKGTKFTGAGKLGLNLNVGVCLCVCVWEGVWGVSVCGGVWVCVCGGVWGVCVWGVYLTILNGSQVDILYFPIFGNHFSFLSNASHIIK